MSVLATSLCLFVIIVVACTQSGSISIDGEKLTSMNVKGLRSCMGVVSQEPRLFAMSIKDCIAMGM